MNPHPLSLYLKSLPPHFVTIVRLKWATPISPLLAHTSEPLLFTQTDVPGPHLRCRTRQYRNRSQHLDSRSLASGTEGQSTEQLLAFEEDQDKTRQINMAWSLTQITLAHKHCHKSHDSFF